jgi:hypothetical protein
MNPKLPLSIWYKGEGHYNTNSRVPIGGKYSFIVVAFSTLLLLNEDGNTELMSMANPTVALSAGPIRVKDMFI